MTKSEHERERRAFWDARFAVYNGIFSQEMAAMHADNALAERDKRFPAPEESEKP